jgi:hypothetical protein
MGGERIEKQNAKAHGIGEHRAPVVVEADARAEEEEAHWHWARANLTGPVLESCWVGGVGVSACVVNADAQ